jgi:integrase
MAQLYFPAPSPADHPQRKCGWSIHYELGEHSRRRPNTVGKPLHPSNFPQRSFHPLLERARLPRIRFHDLRHSAATLLLGPGIHLKIV